MQISGHIKREDGTPVYALEGRWNEYLTATPCDEAGDPLPDAEPLELWRVSPSGEGGPFFPSFQGGWSCRG